MEARDSVSVMSAVVVRDPNALLGHVEDIRRLADTERSSLGFLRAQAYEDAVRRRRLFALVDSNAQDSPVLGSVLFSGVYPQGKIQQIVVRRDMRRRGFGSTLLRSVLSHLEERGFLEVRAEIADDLSHSLQFYMTHGFVFQRRYRGGAVLGREILVYARLLNNPTLFDDAPTMGPAAQWVLNAGLRLRRPSSAPLYVIDVNVWLDLTSPSPRPRRKLAKTVLRAALDHRIRLAVTSEMRVELERGRSRGDGETDPVLDMLEGLPIIPSSNSADHDRLASSVYKLVFDERSMDGPAGRRRRSDARHLAAAALGQSSGYITSDGELLDARDTLLSHIHVDVTSLEEFSQLVPAPVTSGASANFGLGILKVRSEPLSSVLPFLQAEGIALNQYFVSRDFASPSDLTAIECDIVSLGNATLAISVFCRSRVLTDRPETLIHVSQDSPLADPISEYLIGRAFHRVSATGPASLNIIVPSGQISVARAAVLMGFAGPLERHVYMKAILGRPLTPSSFPALVRQLQRTTGLSVSQLDFSRPNSSALLGVADVDGQDRVDWSDIEHALAPTVIAFPGRRAVVIPIKRDYSADLLGADSQLPLWGLPTIQLSFRRTYFGTSRAQNIIHPHQPVLFYETLGHDGLGAVVAVARVVDAVVYPKGQVPPEQIRRGVVDDPDGLNLEDHILATTFENIMVCPRPVGIDRLRALGVLKPHNLQSPTPISHDILCAILDYAWKAPQWKQ